MRSGSGPPQAVAYGGNRMPCVNALRRVESLVRFHIYLSRILWGPHNLLYVPPSSRRRLWGFSFMVFWNFFQPSGPGQPPSFLPYILNALWRILPFSGFPDHEDPKSHCITIRNIPLFHRFEKPTRFLRVTVALFNPLKSVVFLNCVKKWTISQTIFYAVFFIIFSRRDRLKFLNDLILQTLHTNQHNMLIYQI